MFLSLWIVRRSAKGLRFQTTTPKGGWSLFNCYSWYAFAPVGGGGGLWLYAQRLRMVGLRVMNTSGAKGGSAVKNLISTAAHILKFKLELRGCLLLVLILSQASKAHIWTHSSWDGPWNEEQTQLPHYSKLHELFFRDVCTEQFRRHFLRLGGSGTVVEIDKTFLTWRKYKGVGVIEKQWCFGGIERGTN